MLYSKIEYILFSKIILEKIILEKKHNYQETLDKLTQILNEDE